MKVLKSRIGLFVLLIIGILSASNSYAQVIEGSIANDFTFTDIHGKTINLFTYLNEGKYVAIDVFATWCNPCWRYMQEGVLDSLYDELDSPGTNTWKIITIQGDPTADSTLYGINGQTQGNWVTGHRYTIINPPNGQQLSDFTIRYNINWFPTLLLICPEKTVFSDTLGKGNKATVAIWEYLAKTACVEPTPPMIFAISLSPNPVQENLSLSFSLPQSSNVQVSIHDIFGKAVSEKSYAGTIGLNDLTFDSGLLQPGMYTISVTGNGISGVQKFIKN